MLPNSTTTTAVDPTQLAFAHALHPFEAASSAELGLKKDEIVAVLGTTDPVTGLESEWWRGRTRDGHGGVVPPGVCGDSSEEGGR